VQIKETQKSRNWRDLGVGREPFTLQNVRESVLCVWLSVCWEFSVVADQMCFWSTVDLREVSRGLLLALYFLELLK
jgi:hypothetical protein